MESSGGPGDAAGSRIVFGTCNSNFTCYRRLRSWDEKRELFCSMETSKPQLAGAAQQDNSSSNLSPSRNKSKWTARSFKKLHHSEYHTLSENTGSFDNVPEECETDNIQKTKRKLTLTRGSSEKALMMSRFRKQHSVSEPRPPDSAWRPRLTLRTKSFCLEAEQGRGAAEWLWSLEWKLSNSLYNYLFRLVISTSRYKLKSKLL